ncbi:hypothetical protein YPPY72_1883, partial [Yersinia pestis PY-72]
MRSIPIIRLPPPP